MTGTLLTAALAVLLWPGAPGIRAHRVAVVAGYDRPAPTGWPAVPRPLVTGVVTAGLAALLATPLVAVLAGGAALVARVREADRAGRRAERDVRGLAEGLAALAAELRSGRSLEAATTTAAAAVPDATVGRALGAAVRAPDGHVGLHLDRGVRAALDRVAAGAALSARTGCSLTAVLTAVEDDLRARAGRRLELRSATAGPRAGAAVLAGLPLLGLVMGSGVGADPWRVLTTTSVGQVLLVAGVLLELVGLAWTRRLVERALR